MDIILSSVVDALEAPRYVSFTAYSILYELAFDAVAHVKVTDVSDAAVQDINFEGRDGLVVTLSEYSDQSLLTSSRTALHRTLYLYPASISQ